MISSFEIAWREGRRVTARLSLPDSETGPAVLLAHGAGAGQDHPGLTALRDGLSRAGHIVLTFNYPYMEEARRRPDPTESLLTCHRAAAVRLRAETGEPIVLAGRSMGGRMGSLLAAGGEPCAALILYAYPLHPVGKTDVLRKDHLTRISSPMLFFTGTRDAMARLDLVHRWIRSLPNALVEIVEDADHAFRVPKSSGRTQEELLAWIASRSAEWIQDLGRSS
ncbi:MAG TPA: alpha/beta family hydrolase [Acidimicrobiia bacterium]